MPLFKRKKIQRPKNPLGMALLQYDNIIKKELGGLLKTLGSGKSINPAKGGSIVDRTEYKLDYILIRYIGLAIYLVFSWVQVWAYKSLGENYSQDILIKKDHQLVKKGPFRIVRHPQYLSQILIDLGGAAATLSYIVAPLAIVQIPFIIMRASLEDKLLAKYFTDEFVLYKKKSGFIFPFIG